jgi:hypothetical protein
MPLADKLSFQMNNFKKISWLLLLLALTAPAALAQQLKPEATEDWSRRPALVRPGKNSRPPSDALVLFGSKKDLAQWEHPDGSPVKWKTRGKALVIEKDATDIRTKQAFGSVQLHVEWKTPNPKEDRSNSRGNSGVFLMGLYELQIYESYQDRSRIYYNGQAGSIYKQHIPLVNACLPPQTWQTFDIVFNAPVFNADKTLQTPAYMTVFHNGVLILNQVALKGPMQYQGLPQYTFHPEKLPLSLQEHDSRVRFRNIWVREL